MQEEISLAELLNGVLKLINVVLKKWAIILSISVVAGIIGFFYAKFSNPIYEANASFGVEGKGGSSSNSTAMAIASQLGFPLGGSGVFPDNKMLVGISLSRKVIKSSLLLRDTTNQKSVSLGTELLQYYKMYIGKSDNVKFNTTDINKLSFLEDSILDILYQKCVSDMVNLNIDDDVGLVRMKVKSFKPELSVQFSKNILFFLDYYFIENNKREAFFNYSIAQIKADSIMNLLKEKEVELARLNDSRISSVKFEGKIEQTRLGRDVMILSKMYAEVSANVELQKFSLSNEKTILIIIDEPNFSLEIIKRNIVKITALFFFVSVLLLSVIFILIDSVSNGLKQKD
ncbi:MAG: hypothetical protein RJA07_2038 [Bacteroidota bacterium]|jgi:hypothetical protein